MRYLRKEEPIEREIPKLSIEQLDLTQESEPNNSSIIINPDCLYENDDIEVEIGLPSLPNIDMGSRFTPIEPSI